MAKFTECKKCGSQRVAWAKNKNGNWYLAFAVNTSVFRPGEVSARIPHKCDSRTVGGFDACPHCNRHHTLTSYGEENPAYAHCDRYPNAPTSS